MAREQKNLVIAVHKSQTATLLHTDSQQRIRGINADYLNLLKRALNIKLTLREYADHQKAMDALEDGEVDIVLSHLVASPPLNDDIAATNPLIITFRRWSLPFTIQCDRLPHQNQ